MIYLYLVIMNFINLDIEFNYKILMVSFSSPILLYIIMDTPLLLIIKYF